MDISRRSVLRSTAVGSAAALAGCFLNPSRDSEDPSPVRQIGNVERSCHPTTTASADIYRGEGKKPFQTQDGRTRLTVKGIFPGANAGVGASGHRTATDDDRPREVKSEATTLVVVVHPLGDDVVYNCREKEGVAHTNFEVGLRLAATDQFVVALLDDRYNDFPNELVLLATWPAQQGGRP